MDKYCAYMKDKRCMYYGKTNTPEHRMNIVTLIKEHGIDETLTICEEEASELIKAITKYKRAKSKEAKEKRRSELIEEMADIRICIDMLSSIFDVTERELEKEIEVKMERNMDRL